MNKKNIAKWEREEDHKIIDRLELGNWLVDAYMNIDGTASYVQVTWKFGGEVFFTLQNNQDLERLEELLSIIREHLTLKNTSTAAEPA